MASLCIAYMHIPSVLFGRHDDPDGRRPNLAMARRAVAATLLAAVIILASAAATDGTTPALRGQSLLQMALGRSCPAGPSAALAWTMCARATPARSPLGELIHVAGARELPGLLRRRTPGEATLVLFYGRRCRFSASLLPAFAAVAARLPVCAVAVEAVQLPALGPAFAVYGLPTVLRLQNGRTDARYSGDRSFRDLMRWARNVTGAERTPVRWAMDTLPEIDVAASAARPDWALVVSTSVTLATMLTWASARHQREQARPA